MTLTIVANIEALPGKETFVETELLKLIPITLAEAGCLQYDLHRDNENPCQFLFFERWESRDLWQAHTGAPHLKAYVEATEGMIGEFAVHEMTKLD
jgi:quinol monooxygenase YgiN